MHAQIRIIKHLQIEFARGSSGEPRQKVAARRDVSTSAAAARLRSARATGVPLLSSRVARGAPRAAARLTASATCRDFAGGPRAHHARHSGLFPRVSRESRATPNHTPRREEFRQSGAAVVSGNPRGRFLPPYTRQVIRLCTCKMPLRRLAAPRTRGATPRTPDPRIPRVETHPQIQFGPEKPPRRAARHAFSALEGILIGPRARAQNN